MAALTRLIKPNRTIFIIFRSSVQYNLPSRVQGFASSSANHVGELQVAQGENAESSSLPARSQPAPKMLIPPANDPLLEYLAAHLMRHGEKNKANKLVTGMLAEIYKLTKSPPLPIFRNAISLASPSIRMKSHKKNAKNVQVPTPLNDRQRTFFAMKWLITASKSRSEKRVEERLAREVMRVVDGESEVLRKKMEVHKVAVANRSNATFRGNR